MKNIIEKGRIQKYTQESNVSKNYWETTYTKKNKLDKILRKRKQTEHLSTLQGNDIVSRWHS